MPATTGDGAGKHVIATIEAVFPDCHLDATLRTRIREVFDRRNLTLHYEAKREAMGPHPLGLTTTWVARTFTVETARASVEAIASLLTTVTREGRSPVAQANWWAERNRFVGKKLALGLTGGSPLDLVP